MNQYGPIKEEVEKLGYYLISVKSTNDENIKSVLAHSDVKNEYAVWFFNNEMKGLFSGSYHSHYDGDMDRALNLALERYQNAH